MIFAREPSDALAGLVKRIDEQCLKHKKQDLSSAAIFCAKTPGLRPALGDLAKKHALKEVILATLDEAPKGYQINKDAEITVILYTGAAVKANHVFRKGELDEKGIASVIKDVSKILPND
jgi:hypothetical protein